MDTPALNPPARARREQRYFRFRLEPADVALMDQLPEEQRAALLSDGSYRDRAGKLNIPIGTLRSRLHRGRAALQALRDDAARDQAPAPAH